MHSADTEIAIARSIIPRASRTWADHTFCIGICLLCLLMAAGRQGSPAWSSEIIPADPAIGRLNHAGFKSRAHCTSFTTKDGALITAAHCLPGILTDTVHVLLGYEQGTLQHHSRTPASAYLTLPERDIAALCNAPKTSGGMTLSQEPPSPGTKITVRGYGAPNVHVLQETTCSVQTTSNPDFVVLDCALPPGTSGAPVTIAETGHIIGLVSASAPARTLVSRLTPDMIEHLCG